MSPLLQQLQLPVQPLQPRQYPLTPSPKQPPTPSSPRTSMTSPGRGNARSPRPGVANSPRQVVQSGGGSTLQQQLMQPPSIKYPQSLVTVSQQGGGASPRYSVPIVTTTQSILSAQLSQPPRSSSISLTRTPNNPIVVSSPDIVSVSQAAAAQGGYIQVSQGGQILQVAPQSLIQQHNQSQECVIIDIILCTKLWHLLQRKGFIIIHLKLSYH
ncbi:MAG: hypothetical protein GY696_20175 [Gammaproteobacteria bacterium]|nr:hypothetical protein [Gammaproteobacteria bacterium]